MKPRFKIFSLLLVVVLTALFINSAYAERKVLNNVPYIHQVEDMNQNEFLGHNSCGPTSAVMMAEFHNTQPDNQSSTYAGWYVWNSYENGFTDKSGRNYSNIKETWDMNAANQHIHEIRNGAHGYIIVPNGNNWPADSSKIEEYLENHGLKVEQKRINKEGTADEIYEIVKQNIDVGLPLVCSLIATDLLGNIMGHYMVVIGYDTGANGDEQKLVLNDPYGDRNQAYDETKGYWPGGELVTYNYPTITTRTNFYRFFTVHPVGIYDHSPGWIKSNNSEPESQIVVDAYDPFAFVLGSPMDNGGSVFVHALPREPWLPDLFGQDFQNGMVVINENEQKAYVIRGAFVWLYRGGQWINPENNEPMDTIWGPNDLGAPRSNEVFEYFTNEFGEQVVIRQYFEHGRLTYLLNGQSTGNGIINIELLPSGIYPPDDAIEVPAETDNGYEYISGGDIPLDLTGFGGGGDDPDDPESTPCPIPQNLTATAINSSQISVSWDFNPDVLQYKIYFQGNGQEYDILVENNPRLFSGLEPNTICTFRIQANYGNESWSEILDPVQATTLPFDGSDIVVYSMTTCKGLIDYKESVNSTNYFDNRDDDIYFIIKLEDNYPYGALYFRFDLYYPNNELNRSFDRLGNYDLDGPNFTTCAQLNSEENNLYHYHGIWTIKIFFGSTIYDITNYLTTYQFEIKNLPPEKVTGVTIE